MTAETTIHDSIATLAEGLHRLLPARVYHERVLGFVGNGALKHLERSAAHYHAWATSAEDEEDEESKALRFGRIFHAALFEPEIFAADFVVAPDFGDCRRRENKLARDTWRAANTGKTRVDADEMVTAEGMARAVRSHRLAGRALAGCEHELTAIWKDPATGLRCKVRPDAYKAQRALIVDIKTTIDASREAFGRSLFKYGYDVQAELYLRGMRAVGCEARNFVFVAVEKSPPFAVGVYTLDERGKERARMRIDDLMGRMAECVRTNTWPGYPDTEPLTIETPPWLV